jgi:hypothetical protein
LNFISQSLKGRIKDNIISAKAVNAYKIKGIFSENEKAN